MQKDLEKIYAWSCENKIQLNCNKCKFISFVRSAHKFSFDYSISGVFLERVQSIKDLGIIYQTNFEFDIHLRMVTSRAYKLLGFIKRSSKEFKTVDSIIHLYKTLVRPILIYGSIIWSPYRLYLIKELESVQHRLLRYVAFKMGNSMSYDDHNYSDIAALIKLESLKSLHVYHDIYFVKKVQLKLVNCDDTFKLFVKRNISYDLRVTREFSEDKTIYDYIYYSTVPRLRRRWNKILVPSDISNVNNLTKFKSGLKRLVNRFK